MSQARKIDCILGLLTLVVLASVVFVGAQQQQQQQQIPPKQQQPNSDTNSLQAHLDALQSQAQRQINALASQSGPRGAAMLEVLSNVGKAIQQQVNSAANDSSLMGTIRKQVGQPGQSISVEQGQTQTNLPAATGNQQNYREQGEQLRQEIVRRAGHLQQVVAGSMEALKSSSDLIVRRLLEQLNGRLDQAKSKADRIINESTSNEMGIRALNTINQGLNNVNNIITNIVNRLNLQQSAAGSPPQAGASETAGQAAATQSRTGLLLDPNRFRMNLQQIGQQFSSAISAVAAQQQQQRMGGADGAPNVRMQTGAQSVQQQQQQAPK